MGYVEEWVYDLLYPIIESNMPDSELVESLIEDGPNIKDLFEFVRK